MTYNDNTSVSLSTTSFWFQNPIQARIIQVGINKVFYLKVEGKVILKEAVNKDKSQNKL